MALGEIWEGKALDLTIRRATRIVARLGWVSKETSGQCVQDAIGDAWLLARDGKLEFATEKDLRVYLVDDALRRIMRDSMKREVSKDEDIEERGNDGYSRFDYIAPHAAREYRGYHKPTQIDYVYADEIRRGLARLPALHRTITEMVGDGHNIVDIGIALHLRPAICLRRLDEARGMLWRAGLIEQGIDQRAGIWSMS
jgi:hypothetical protein